MTDERGQERPVEWFHPTSGGVMGWVAIAAGVAVALLSTGVGTTAAASWTGVMAGLLVALLAWVALLRPRVGMTDSAVVLRGMVSTTTVPLAAVESVVVRQVLALRAGGHRYVSAAVGHTYRSLARARRSPTGEPVPAEGGQDRIPYADHVATVITQRSGDALRAAGVARRSAEHAALAEGVRRRWAWPELAALALLLVLLVLTLLL